MEHSFDIAIADKYGIKEAILLRNIYFWIEKNRANSKHFHNGTYWTYNSCKAFSELFPYMTEKQVRTALKNLEDQGLIESNNFNDVQYDRTKWYSITQLGSSILLNGKMEFTNKANGLFQKGEPIPDINTDVNTDHKPYKENKQKKKQSAHQAPSYPENFLQFYTNYPRPQDKGRSLINWKNLLAEGFDADTLILCGKRYAQECDVMKKEKQYTTTSANFLGEKRTFENYLDENYKPDEPTKQVDGFESGIQSWLKSQEDKK